MYNGYQTSYYKFCTSILFTVTLAFVWSSIFKCFSHYFFQHFISKVTFLFNLWFQTLVKKNLFSTLAIYKFYFYYFRLSNFATVFYLHPLENQGRLMRKVFYMLPFSMILSLSPKQNRSWEVKAKSFLRGESKTVLERWKQNRSWEVKAKPFLRGESKTILERWKQNCSWEVKAKPFYLLHYSIALTDILRPPLKVIRLAPMTLTNPKLFKLLAKHSIY